MLLSNVVDEDGGQSCSCGSDEDKSLSAIFTNMSDISGTSTEGTQSVASWFEPSFEIVTSAYALPYLLFSTMFEDFRLFPIYTLNKIRQTCRLYICRLFKCMCNLLRQIVEIDDRFNNNRLSKTSSFTFSIRIVQVRY